jgi:hypothetical protein
MPCFLTEAAPRACTRRRSIVMATSCRLARCWLYSKEIGAQVGSNQPHAKSVRLRYRKSGSQPIVHSVAIESRNASPCASIRCLQAPSCRRGEDGSNKRIMPWKIPAGVCRVTCLTGGTIALNSWRRPAPSGPVQMDTPGCTPAWPHTIRVLISLLAACRPLF